MLRYLLTGLFTALVLSESAAALSCRMPQLGEVMEEAKASEKVYYILVGKFTSQPVPKPQISQNLEDFAAQYQDRPAQKVRAVFEGYSLAQHPYMDTPLTRFPVEFNISCLGPWCGNAPANGQDVIVFTEEQEGQAPVLQIGPCPQFVFDADTQKVQKLRDCFDQSCAARQLIE